MYLYGLMNYSHISQAKASVAFFFLYYVFFGIGWQGVPWLYPTEINSLSMRTKGAALGTATNVSKTLLSIKTNRWRTSSCARKTLACTSELAYPVPTYRVVGR